MFNYHGLTSADSLQNGRPTRQSIERFARNSFFKTFSPLPASVLLLTLNCRSLQKGKDVCAASCVSFGVSACSFLCGPQFVSFWRHVIETKLRSLLHFYPQITKCIIHLISPPNGTLMCCLWHDPHQVTHCYTVQQGCVLGLSHLFLILDDLTLMAPSR